MAEYKDKCKPAETTAEARQSLAAISQALEHYLDAPPTHRQLSLSRAQLHQGLVPLKQLGPLLPRLLAGELLETAEALLDQHCRNAQFSAETLSQGLAQLQGLLAAQGQPTQPPAEALVRVLNALRDARYQKPLSAVDFFDPIMVPPVAPLEKEQLDQLVQSGAIKVLKSIRQKYQICLASYLRKKEAGQSLRLMSRLFGKLQNLTWGTPSARLWDAGAALVTGLFEQVIAPSEKSNDLLKALDFQLKQLIESVGLEINHPPTPALLKSLLYQVAQANTRNSLILALKQQYQLDQALAAVPAEPPPQASPRHKKPAAAPHPLALEELHRLAIMEARTELGYALDALEGRQKSRESLGAVPALLDSASKTLNLSPLTRYATLIRQVAGRFQDALKPYSPSALAGLQRTLAALDRALEQLQQGQTQAAEQAFSQASQNLEQQATVTETPAGALAGMAFEDLELVCEKESEPSAKQEPSAERAPSAKEEFLTEKRQQTSPKAITKAVQSPPFAETAQNMARQLTAAMAHWHSQSHPGQIPASLHQTLIKLKECAQASDAHIIGELAATLAAMLKQLTDGKIQPGNSMLTLLDSATAMLPELINDFCCEQQLLTAEVLLCMEQADDLARGESFFEPQELASLEALDAPPKAGDSVPETAPEKTPERVLEKIPEKISKKTPERPPAIKPDPTLLPLFLREASGITRQCSQVLAQWLTQDRDGQDLHVLQRSLHTLKGSARMLGLNALAELSHALESLYEILATGERPIAETPLGLLQQSHSHMDAMLQALALGHPDLEAGDLIRRLEQWCHSKTDHDRNHGQDSNLTLPDYLGRPATATPLADASATVEPLSRDSIALSLDGLEQLGQLSGEACVQRAQVARQVQHISQVLGDMDTTTLRIKNQLRRLENLDHGPDHREQTRLYTALAEAVSDLVELRQSLQDQSHNASQLLQQQAQPLARLQKQLCETPLVPFERLLPRIRKTAEQMACELHKPIKLHIRNARVKVHRAVLDKLQAPLEHIIRNAIDHGIENSPAQRRQAGKPEAGQITLTFSCASGHTVVAISDDGRGIDLEAIRAKAEARHLLDQTDQPDRDELLQLVFAPGLSTASEVTQVSGRGRGLDVVNSEIAGLGGHIRVDSQPGQGACFSLHLPVSSPVTRVLLVRQQDSLYAMAMTAIDGLAMISQEALLACYQNRTPLEHAGSQHRLLSFNRLLGHKNTPVSTGQAPVILLRRGGERLALHVDAIAGSREIITQPLGPQFKGLTGISGATLLDDSAVVVVIEPLALVQKHGAAQALSGGGELVIADNGKPGALRILVVDDSITMRKITSRLLSRHGYQVSAAQNGADALRLIARQRPDLVLLDVEMPGMDGFELARTLRNDPALKNLPIVMVTSRTGKKYKRRAMTLNIHDYVGKPLEESLLIKTVEKHLDQAGS